MDISKFDFELAHIGINQDNDKEALKTAQILKDLFGFETRETSGSIFSNEQFEIMKMPYLGELGHIAIRTSHIDEAIDYLKSQAIDFDESSAIKSDDGKINAIYFKEDIAGFRFHLVRR